MQSESIGNLAKALAAAQAAIKPPKKGKTANIESGKGGYSYSYADLADVIESYREPLSRHGLAVAQTMRLQDGHMVLVTKLMHESNEWLDSEYPIPSYPRPQEQGSAITYARRYAVTALLGIAAEDDDDGAAAQRSEPKASAKRQEPTPTRAKTPPADGPTDADIENVGRLAKRAGLQKHSDIKPLLLEIGGVESLRMLERRYLPDLIATLERKGDAAAVKDVEEIFGEPQNA